MKKTALLIFPFLFCIFTAQTDSATEGPERGEMIPIPSLEFRMGCNDSKDKLCDGDEKPARKIFLDAYLIDKYEVTAAQYVECVNAGACDPPRTGGYCSFGIEAQNDNPINCVTWSQADGFCKWVGKRLPTEAEWEKSARGEDFRVYPWGNEAPSCDDAVFSTYGWDMWGCGKNTTAPVGSAIKDKSPYGVMDMAGNVSEWTADYYDEEYYKRAPEKNPQGPEKGKYRSRRGGSWCLGADYARVSNRHWSAPEVADHCGGFRCVKNP